MEKLEFKGTKGEWIVDHEESGYNEYNQLCTPISRKDKSYAYIIGFCDVYGDDEQAQANAKLIASAPNLLEALFELYSLVYDAHYNCNNELTPFPTRSALDKSIKAIEKALK